MTDFAVSGGAAQASASRPKLDHQAGLGTLLIFGGILALGLFFVAYSLYVDVGETGTKVTTYLPFILYSWRC